MQLLLTTAWALFFSCFSSPILSAVFTAGLFLAGSFSQDLRELAAVVPVGWVKGALSALYYALPNFRNFNVASAVAHGQAIPLAALGLNTLYGLVYIGVVVAASVVIFQNRDLK
jgi:ABC-type transport system involved in multi-copper enzyme maturation permease subunit